MTTIRAFVLTLACAAALAGSSQAEPRRMCPMIYRPVCAINRFHHFETFANACIAREADAHVRHEGVCRRHR